MTPEQAQQSIANDARALENNLKFLNEIGQLKAPGIQNKPFTDPALDPASAPKPPKVAATATPAAPPATPAPPAHDLGRKIFFTGRLCAGKDHVASKLEGAKVLGFADPIYTLAEFLFNTQVNATSGKDIPGMRKVLQAIGQIGRNEITAQYPLTLERAVFVQMIRSYAQNKIIQLDGVDLESFGLHPDIWIDGLITRSTRVEGRVVATNCRFANEYKKLVDDGWMHFHIICSPQTLAKRLATRGLGPNSPEVNDLSEQMALGLDKQVAAKLSKPGEKLQVVWSDENVPSPSNRLYTVAEFSELAKNT